MDTTPMVPRFVIEPALAEFARKLPPEGAIIVTDRAERLGPLSSNLVQAIGHVQASRSVILVAQTTEAERAAWEQLAATGKLRPIFHDPAMPAYRQPKPVPPPESVEALIEAQARDLRRRLKLERKAARHERRCGHHADLVAMIDHLEARSCIILVQSEAYKDHVIRLARSRRPDLTSPRLVIFVVVCPDPAAYTEMLAILPDWASLLPMHHAPGLGIHRERARIRGEKAEAERAAMSERERAAEAARLEAERIEAARRAEEAAIQAAHDQAVAVAEREARERLLARLRAGTNSAGFPYYNAAPKYAGPVVAVTVSPAKQTLEDRVAVCERILGELMTWFADSMERSPLATRAAVARADWLCGLMNELLDSVQAAR